MQTIGKRGVVSTLTACSLSAWLVACGGGDGLGEGDGLVEESQSALVSGATRISAGNSTSESEAVVAITYEPNGTAHEIVMANADHPSFIIYSDGGTPNAFTDDTRTIYMGASQVLLWHRTGLSGSYTSTRIAAANVGALWGDPAVGASNQYVFASSLRIPRGNFPSNGADFIPISQSHGDSIIPFLAGACIARSFDYGQTWSMTAADCPYDAGHFYDGGAVIANPQGKVFAAYNDSDADQIDVWRTDGPTGAIYQTADPFPGKTMNSHPRMRIEGSPVYLMAADRTATVTAPDGSKYFRGNLWLNRYVSHAWQTPVLAASDVVYYNKVTVNGMPIRLGPGFDFSVYTSPFDGSAQLVFVHSTLVNGKSVLKTGTCNASSGTWSCSMVAGATSNPSVDCFNPAIATGFWSPAPGIGAPSTKITYQRTLSTGNKVALHVSPYDFSATAVRISGWQTPCPDERGYWGDYDSMAVGPDGFHRVFSDSTDSSCVRQHFTSRPLGVSESVIPIH